MNPTQKPRPPVTLPAELTALFGERMTAALCDAIDDAFNDIEAEAAIAGFRRGLECAFGRDYADFVYDDLVGNVDRPNSTFAAERGITRAAVSKMLVKCRRNLGIELTRPGNFRLGKRGPNARPKRTTMPARATDLTKSP